MVEGGSSISEAIARAAAVSPATVQEMAAVGEGNAGGGGSNADSSSGWQHGCMRRSDATTTMVASGRGRQQQRRLRPCGLKAADEGGKVGVGWQRWWRWRRKAAATVAAKRSVLEQGKDRRGVGNRGLVACGGGEERQARPAMGYGTAADCRRGGRARLQGYGSSEAATTGDGR
ncbi:hypothetical protein BHM03_00043190 [Ensete ventricosum]|nr:hypothetical protein BHM03_00043190 [Ensete ventricosum]